MPKPAITNAANNKNISCSLMLYFFKARVCAEEREREGGGFLLVGFSPRVCVSAPLPQALLPSDQEQSMRFCWLSGVKMPVCLKSWPSAVPVAPNDQHEPQVP